MFILLPGILRALVLRKYFKCHVLECALHRPIVGNGLNGLRVEQLKPWSLVYCFTLRAFQLCIKLSRDIKTLCSCRLTLCTSGLSMISISRTLSPGMGMQGVKSYSFLYTKKKGIKINRSKKELPVEVALHSAESFAVFYFPLCCKFINKMCICDTRARNAVGKELA